MKGKGEEQNDLTRPRRKFLATPLLAAELLLQIAVLP